MGDGKKEEALRNRRLAACAGLFDRLAAAHERFAVGARSKTQRACADSAREAAQRARSLISEGK